MSEEITSASNPTVKLLRKLMTSSKERRATNLYIAEGIHLVESFLKTGQTPKMYIYATSATHHPEVSEIVKNLLETSAKEIVLTDALFESFSTVHASSGICIVFEPPEIDSHDSLSGEDDAVLLEKIQDPGNLGTILRTSAAVGIKNILLSSGCASPWSPKALRAGMGAQFGLTLHEDSDLLSALKEPGVFSAATTLSSESISLYDADLRRPTAWIFGSEGSGLSDELASAASITISIPQEATSIESLNVASAASVCLYEQYRQK